MNVLFKTLLQWQRKHTKISRTDQGHGLCDYFFCRSEGGSRADAGIFASESGSGNLQHQDKINKRGNRRLRKILYDMIMSMLSWRAKTQNTIVDDYDKGKKQPNGKLHKVAVIACVNKFLKVAFHFIQHGLLYRYESGKVS